MELGPTKSHDYLQQARIQLETLNNCESSQIQKASAYLKSNLSHKTTQDSFLELTNQLSDLVIATKDHRELDKYRRVMDQIMQLLPKNVPQNSSNDILNSYQTKRNNSQPVFNEQKHDNEDETDLLILEEKKKDKNKCILM